MNFTPLADRLLIEPMTAADISAGGIIIPDMAKQKPNVGIVKAGGTKMDEYDTELLPGDKVLFEANAGVEHIEGGKKYRIIRKMNVLFKYENVII